MQADFRANIGFGCALVEALTGSTGADAQARARGLDDRHELGGGQAGAADQGAVDVGHANSSAALSGLTEPP